MSNLDISNDELADSEYQNPEVSFSPDRVSGIAHGERAVPQGRMAGKFGHNLTSEYQEVMKSLGGMVRDMLLENYDAKQIGYLPGSAYDQTGALREAVAASDITVTTSTKELSVKVALGNQGQTRPEREGQGYESPTMAEVAHWVFQGSPGVAARPGRTLSIHTEGGWIGVRSVRPSRTDLNIFILSAEQRDRLNAEFARRVVPVTKKQLQEALKK